MALRVFCSLAVVAVLAVARGAPAPEPAPLVVIDAAGKEQKLKTWKFTTGIRRLSWLAPAPPAPPSDEDSAASKTPPRTVLAGPEALEYREEESTSFVEGVLTFVPLDRLRGLDYDVEQKTVTARVAIGPKPDDSVILTGTTRFERVNKLSIEAEVDKGELGVAEIRYLGGTIRGIHGLRFPSPQAATPPAGRPALVTTAGKMPATHKVTELQGLYRFANGYERVSPLLMFKKTLKLDIAKIQKIVTAGAEDDSGAWQIQLKNGGDETLTLLRIITLEGKDAQLEGLLGRVPAGYKLFPVLTIGEIQFDVTEAKPDDKPEKSDAKPDK
jgi:hypothetical protein